MKRCVFFLNAERGNDTRFKPNQNAMNSRANFLFAVFGLLSTFNALATTHYVDLNSTNPTPPFTDWSVAATNIQDAVDATVPGDLVLVTNGVYATGGRLAAAGPGGVVITNRIAVTNAITLQSVNGPTTTSIDGGNTMRCLYLTNGAVLSGFTITNGNAPHVAGGTYGGGVYCAITNLYAGELVSTAILENCLVISNTADIGGGVAFGNVSNCLITCNTGPTSGGGTYHCNLANSTISFNSSGFWGGGATGSWLTNCLVLSNTVPTSVSVGGLGGGAFDCTLNNCTVLGNQAYSSGGVYNNGNTFFCYNSIIYYNFSTVTSYGNFNPSSLVTMTNCCSVPIAPGAGNFTNAPLFVNTAAADFHLSSNSPCINAGLNFFVAATTDFDGNPRIMGGTVDLGAYEFQTPSSVLSYVWAQQYGLPTDGTADFADTDGDGMNNWQEWIAGTNPTNAASVLKMTSPTKNGTGLKVSWQSVNTRTYFLQRSTNLLSQPAFSAIKSNLVGQAGTTIFNDTTATNGGPYFYRVGVQ